MKVVVVNFSANVGKTTVAHQLLAPRLNNAPVISVEYSSYRLGRMNLSGRKLGDLFEDAFFLDSVVVDVRGPDTERFFNTMDQYAGCEDDFDFYVVPTISQLKQQRDTIYTIEGLAELGIPAKKIRLVFNMVEPDETPESEFPGLIEYYKKHKRLGIRIWLCFLPDDERVAIYSKTGFCCCFPLGVALY